MALGNEHLAGTNSRLGSAHNLYACLCFPVTRALGLLEACGSGCCPMRG